MNVTKPIEPLVLNLRRQRVIIDADRFPEDFVFRLTEGEKTEVVTKCDHLQNLKFSPQLPAAFQSMAQLWRPWYSTARKQLQ